MEKDLYIMIISISYDLNRPGQQYSDLYDTIKSAPGWAHAMDSLCFIKTNETVDDCSNRIKSVIEKNDDLFLVDITGQPRKGWMSQKIWDWLNKNRN